MKTKELEKKEMETKETETKEVEKKEIEIKKTDKKEIAKYKKAKEKNELVALYNEALKMGEKEGQVEYFKSELKERIGNDKNKYLYYKMLCEEKSFVESITLVISIIGIIVSVMTSQLNVFFNYLNISSYGYIIAFIIILLYLVVVAVMLYPHITKGIPRRNNINFVLDEIYKEEFEGKETK